MEAKTSGSFRQVKQRDNAQGCIRRDEKGSAWNFRGLKGCSRKVKQMSEAGGGETKGCISGDEKGEGVSERKC